MNKRKADNIDFNKKSFFKKANKSQIQDLKNDNENNFIFKKALDILKEVKDIKYECLNNIKICDIYIKRLQNIIYNTCKHDIYRDFSASGPGERSIKICKKCNLIMNDYYYK
jgi:hypothetical protein